MLGARIKETEGFCSPQSSLMSGHQAIQREECSADSPVCRGKSPLVKIVNRRILSTGFSFFGEVTDVLDVLTRQPGLRYSKDDGQNIDPSQSELPQWNTHIRVDIRGQLVHQNAPEIMCFVKFNLDDKAAVQVAYQMKGNRLWLKFT
ncbi:unnamed protein product [Porites lobata]|uniref:Uncharacterized protein n=1 Tax=Porites lobata TaxID=104759 RepID=A0ABN8N5P9_9CNID|nr:unnamed protein product [Porites lobata]